MRHLDELFRREKEQDDEPAGSRLKCIDSKPKRFDLNQGGA
jgi:hypothetical protein